MYGIEFDTNSALFKVMLDLLAITIVCTVRNRRFWSNEGFIKINKNKSDQITAVQIDNRIKILIKIDSLVQDCSNSSALTMELLQSCVKPSRLRCKNSPWVLLSAKMNIKKITAPITNIHVRTYQIETRIKFDPHHSLAHVYHPWHHFEKRF